MCWDFPVALKHYNYYRNDTCTYWMQKVFKLAIPQAHCEESNFMNVLAGHPMHSTIAIGARGMVKNKKDREMLKKSVKLIVDFLQPSNILWYGSTLYGVTDYIIEMGIPTTVYPGKGKGSLSHHGNEGAA